MLNTEVPYWSEIERMMLRRAPIPAFAPNGAAAGVYRALWAEVVGRMGDAPRSVATGSPAMEVQLRPTSGAP